MAISDIKVTFNNATSATVNYTYTPAAGDPRTIDGAFLYFGPANTFDPTQPNLGFPSNARVTVSGNNGTSTFNPGVPQGSTYYFICGVYLSDGNLDASDVQDPTNAPPQGDEANEVRVDAAPAEIPRAGSSVVTVTALANGSPTQGRNASFGFKTGSIKGTFDKPNPVLTGTDGTASVTFTPDEPGQAHIEGEVDGLTAGIKVKVKN